MTATLALWVAIVEDDNGRYFFVKLLAISTDDAKQRLSYILESTSARIVSVKEDRYL